MHLLRDIFKKVRCNKFPYSSRIFIYATLAVILSAVILTCPAAGRAAGNSGISRELESALLSGNWQQVISLASGSSAGEAPVTRFVKAHACLALNRNNESFCLFLGAGPDDLERWRQWSQDFAKSHQGDPVAAYFRGDALARLNRWPEAQEIFAKVLDAKPRPEVRGLLLNARGVVLAAQKKWSAARQDFKDAGDALPQFADAYASRGTLNLHQKEGAQKGVDHLSQALKYSPTFALALHNRGLLQLALKREKESQDDLAKAEQYGGCGAALWLENRVRIMAFLRAMDKNELLALAKAGKPGMTLETSYEKTGKLWETYCQNPTQWNYNRFHENFSMLTNDQKSKFYKGTMLLDLKGNNSLQQKYQNNLGEVGKTNQDNGLAMQTATAIKGLSAVVGASGILSLDPIIAKTVQFAAGLVGTFAADRMNNWTQKNYSVFQTLTDWNAKSLPSQGKPSGVDLSWAGASQDEGKWPFFVCYGLVYPVEPMETQP